VQLVLLVVLELRVILAVLERLVEEVLLVSVEMLERLDQLVQLAAVEQQVLWVLVDQLVILDSLDALDVVEHKEAWDHLEGLVSVEKPVPLAHLEWSAHLVAQGLQVHLVLLVELDYQVCRVAQDLRDPSVQLAIPDQLVLLASLAHLVQVELLVFLEVRECQVERECQGLLVKLVLQEREVIPETVVRLVAQVQLGSEGLLVILE